MATKWSDYPDPRKEWDSRRARPNQEKTVSYKRDGKEYVVTFVTGDCPCEVCGHTDQWQCEEANCECCSELCT